jgi:hypothetical protein
MASVASLSSIFYLASLASLASAEKVAVFVAFVKILRQNKHQISYNKQKLIIMICSLFTFLVNPTGK